MIAMTSRDWGSLSDRGFDFAVVIYIMAGLLVVGFICNLMIKPVTEEHFAKATLAEATA